MISKHRVSSLIYSIVFFSVVVSAQHDYGGAPGHAPFPHDHSTNGTGVCWGYAQGRAAGKCTASDMVPAWQGDDDSQWMTMGIPWPWFTYETPDAQLRTNAQNIIVRFGTQQHAVYLAQAYVNPPKSIHSLAH